MYQRISLFGLLVVLLSVFTPLTTAAQTQIGNSAATNINFADPAFRNIWNRADNLVSSGAVSRSWLWGNGFTLAGNEAYKQAPGGVRVVQYFDKARMEINNPGAPRDRFFVTNGLLVRELISGHTAIGDNPAEIEQRSPADNVAIAGDPIESNPVAPTYATFKDVASLENDRRIPSALGSFATLTIKKNGEVSSNPALNGTYAGLKQVYYNENLGHNIPEIFWGFMNSRSNVQDANGSIVVDNIMDWQKDLGYPLTEAYWTKARVGGTEKDVLVQAFERRVLTYTPSNTDPYKVEMGNVGLHYFNWRYRAGQGLASDAPTQYPLLRAAQAAPGVNAQVFSHIPQVSDSLDDLNVKWVRQQVIWEAFEPNKGQRDFTFLDEVVNSLAARNYKIVLSTVRAPRWANPNGGMPLNPQDYADFMSAMANRYKGKVAAYEIWNEQNLAHEAGKPIQVSRYVQLLKAGYTAVKQVDPFTVVMSGGLSPVGFIDVNYAIDDVAYLKQFYAYNNGEAKKYFDVMGAHPGSTLNPPDTLWPEVSGPGPGWVDDSSFYFRRIEQIRKVMVDNGDGNKQMWLTEFGWASSPTPAPGYEYAKFINEEKQAQYIARAFEKGYKEYPWMGVMLLWQLNFALPSITSNENDEKNSWGIIRRDGSKRPSYFAVQEYAQSWRWR